MRSKGPNHRRAVALLAVAFAVGAAGCSSPDGDGAAGSGGTAGTGGSAGTGGTNGSENPCLQPGNPACSTATLENGFGEIQLFFDEQRVEAVSGTQFFATSQKQGGPSASFSVSAFEEMVDCSTDQPGDAFSEVECASYWIESFIQGAVGQWINLVFTASDGGSAPVTARVTSDGGTTYTLEATWGIYPCTINGVSSPECDEAFSSSAPSYTLCDADEASCELWFQTPNRATEITCNQICGAEQCIGAYDDDMQRPCTMTTELPCTETLADGVCLCSL